MEELNPSSTKEPLKEMIPTVKLRDKIREYIESHREHLRANALDSLRFGIGEIKARVEELDNIAEKDVTALAGRIKRRKHATKEDMYRLSHAFLQDLKNIETFSKIPGAIQVLVKELTGNDSERQLGSAECLCNLSLGEAPVCEKIASAAGSYLVTYLHTAEAQLVRVCLWTLANILATGHKGSLILMQMQLLPQLWKLYVDDAIANDITDFREDSAICLQLIALNNGTLLKNEDRVYILEHFMEKNPNSLAREYHLQIIFHTLFPYPELVSLFCPSRRLYLINYSLNNICNTNDFLSPAHRSIILYSIRILSNLLASQPSCYSILLEQLSSVWHTNLTVIFNTLFSFQNSHLTQEGLWFLKNILFLENSISLFQTNFLETLRVYKNNVNSSDNNKQIKSMID